MSISLKDFNVAIVGGGMCGLACAIGLRRAGIDVTVFEAASKFDEVGAGVGIGSNALRALQGLGVLEAVLAKINQTAPDRPLLTLITGTGDHELVYDYAEHSPGNLGIGIYRPQFLDALMPLLDSDITKFNKRCVSVGHASSGRQVMHFADNTTYEADLIIGADGIRSVTRDAVVSDSHLVFSNTYAYRGLIPIDTLKLAGIKTDVGSRPYCWVGLGKHMITFPVKNYTFLNVVAFVRVRGKGNSMSPERPPPWVEVVPQQEVIDEYPGWGDDAKIILQYLKQPSRWSIHTLYPPLETFVNEKIMLVGDAAHGMLPHLGAGVGQGFEDVYTICRLLSYPKTTKSNLDIVIKVYDAIRRPHANMVLERSIRVGVIYDNFGPNHYNAEDMRRHLAGHGDPVWLHDLDTEVTEAIEAIGWQ